MAGSYIASLESVVCTSLKLNPDSLFMEEVLKKLYIVLRLLCKLQLIRVHCNLFT